MKKILKTEKFIRVGKSEKGYLNKREAKGCLNSAGVKDLNSSLQLDLSEGRTSRKADFVYELTRFNVETMCLLDLEKCIGDNGHTFTSVYAVDGRYKMTDCTQDNWRQSQCYFVDLDDVEYSLDSIWEKIPSDKLPTIGYYSFTQQEYIDSGIRGKYRIRLLYVFSEPTTSPLEFNMRSQQIHKMVADALDISIKDNCGTRYNQIFYGSTFGATKCSQNVYDLEDFPVSVPFSETNGGDTNDSIYNNSISLYFSSDVNGGFGASPTNTENSEKGTPSTLTQLLNKFDRSLIGSIFHLWKCPSLTALKSYLSEFDDKYGWKWYTASPWIWPDSDYVLRPNWYYRINFAFKCDTKIHNHRGRKKTLQKWAVIRRAINPEVTGNELLFCMAYDMFMYTDYTDHTTSEHQKITIFDLCSRVNAVMEMDMASVYAEASEGQRTHVINPNRTSEQKAKIRGKINHDNASKAKDEILGDICRLHPYESAAWVAREADETYGKHWSEDTVKNWMNENGYSTKVQPKAEYNPSLSLRANAEAMGISVKRVRTIKEKMTKILAGSENK